MLETTAQISNIQVVRAIVPINGVVAVTFHNGQQATVPADHPDRDLILQQAEGSLRRQVSVGFLVDATGRLIDLQFAHQVRVQGMGEDPADSSRLRVTFWGYSAVCYLTRDHLEFERIQAVLSEAAATGRLLWFANQSWPVEGEGEVWNRIMDVRPCTG